LISDFSSIISALFSSFFFSSFSLFFASLSSLAELIELLFFFELLLFSSPSSPFSSSILLDS
jgi:hypothetical protein